MTLRHNQGPRWWFFLWLAAALAVAALAGTQALAQEHTSPQPASPRSGAETVTEAMDPPGGEVPPADPLADSLPAIDLETLLDNVEARLREIGDVSLTLRGKAVNPTDLSEMPLEARLLVRFPNLARVEYVRPEMFAGMILVIDQGSHRVEQYHPIIERWVTHKLDDFAREFGLAINFDDILGLADRQHFRFTYEGVRTNDHLPYYVVTARPVANPAVGYSEFWIDPVSWLAGKVQVFDGRGRLVVSLRLQDMLVNQGLADAQLRDRGRRNLHGSP